MSSLSFVRPVFLSFISCAVLVSGQVSTVLAQTTPIWQTTENCLVALKEQSNHECWLQKNMTYQGNALRQSNGVYLLKSVKNKPAVGMTDITLDLSENKQVLLIAKAMPEVVSSLSITGKPYLYGYLMDDTTKGQKITSYLQKGTMRSSAGSGKWGIVYGVFSVKATDDALRLLLKQAQHANYSFTGTGGSFKDLGIFIVDNQKEADQIVTDYQNSL